jgi:uncharacterized phage protein (TIGR02216 family)
MMVGLGVLGWPPTAFWQATPHELWAALDGWRQVNAASPPASAPVSQADFDAIKARFKD